MFFIRQLEKACRSNKSVVIHVKGLEHGGFLRPHISRYFYFLV